MCLVQLWPRDLSTESSWSPRSPLRQLDCDRRQAESPVPVGQPGQPEAPTQTRSEQQVQRTKGKRAQNASALRTSATTPLVVRSEEKVHSARMKLAPSYVELLTCLEIAKQAKELPKEPGLG